MNHNSDKGVDTISLQPIEIQNIKDLSAYLNTLKANASSSFISIIDAQLILIEYSKSPKVIHTLLDQFLEQLHSARQKMKNENEKIAIREISQILVHNLIILINAKLEYSISQNKFLGKDLLKNANSELLNSCISIVKSCLLGVDNNTLKADLNLALKPNLLNEKYVIKNITLFIDKIENDFTKETTSIGSDWDKTVHYDTTDTIRIADLNNHISTIEAILDKLDANHNVIGKSYLISTAIDNYAKKIITLQNALSKALVKQRIQKYKPVLLGLCLILLVLTVFGKVIYESIFKGTTLFENSNFNMSVLLYNWMIFAVIFFLFYLYIIFPKIKVMRYLGKIAKDYRALSQKYLEI